MLQEMLFVFPAKIQSGIASGAYEVVKNSAGVALGLARDKATGQFVGHAIATVAQPFLALPQMALGGLSVLGDIGLSLQMNRGFQKSYQMLETLQQSVGLLQATTALIGVASFAGVALGAVNLYQIMKLRQEVKELKLTINDGFSRTLEEINKIPDVVMFEHHRTILIMAYGQFLEATKLMKIAMKIEDVSARNVNLSNAQLHLSNALNAYHQNDLFHQTCAAGQLRRYEIIWMMEQAQAFNYLLLNAPEAASHCLEELQQQVTTHSLGIIDHCQSEAELDFIYPEMAKIHTQDLPLLKAWQHQIDWSKQLSPSDKQELAMLMQQDTETLNISDENTAIIKPPEMTLYQELKSKSHYQSLRDQLKFIVNPQLRQGYQHYIKEQAIANEQKGIASANLESITDLTIANLFHYLKETELVV